MVELRHISDLQSELQIIAIYSYTLNCYIRLLVLKLRFVSTYIGLPINFNHRWRVVNQLRVFLLGLNLCLRNEHQNHVLDLISLQNYSINGVDVLKIYLDRWHLLNKTYLEKQCGILNKLHILLLPYLKLRMKVLLTQNKSISRVPQRPDELISPSKILLSIDHHQALPQLLQIRLLAILHLLKTLLQHFQRLPIVVVGPRRAVSLNVQDLIVVAAAEFGLVGVSRSAIVNDRQFVEGVLSWVVRH